MELHDNRPASYTTWSTKQVISWLQGLGDVVEPYIPEFTAKGIDGKWLNVVTAGTLKKLGVNKVGHQMIIMEKIRQLQNQYSWFDTETMQTILSRVSRSCVCILAAVKSLMAITERQDSREPDADSVYPGILDDIQDAMVYVVSSILALMSAVMNAAFWLERPPFHVLPEMNDFRQFILGRALIANRTAQLAISTHPNSHFKEVLSYIESVRDRVEEVIKNCSDSILLTPCGMELVHIRKVDAAEFGIQFQSTLHNVHMIVSVQEQSPAFCSAKVNKGDELIEVNDQVVIGWQHHRVADLIRLHPRRMTLRLRKRPAHATDFTGFPGGGRRHRIVMASGPQNPAAGILSQQLVRGGYFTRNPKQRAHLTGALMNEPLASTQESASEVVTTTTTNTASTADVSGAYTSPVSRTSIVGARNTISSIMTVAPTTIIEPHLEETVVSGLSSSLTRSPSNTTITSSSSSSRCASVKLPHSLKSPSPSSPLDVSLLGEMDVSTIVTSSIPTMTATSTVSSSSSLVTPYTSPNIEIPKPSSCRGVFQPTVLFQPTGRMISSTPCTPLMTARILKNGSNSSHERSEQCMNSVASGAGDSADDWNGSILDRRGEIDDAGADRVEDDTRSIPPKSSASTTGKSIFPHFNMMHRRTASGGPSLSLFNSGGKETTPSDSGDPGGSFSHRVPGGNRLQTVDKRQRNFIHRGSLEDIGRLRKLMFGPKKASRRISCKELGRGDCQGWLWLKKSNAFVSKYVKRWCVFKHSTLYYYRNPEDDGAEGLILLHGFIITPASEVKSGRFGFYVFNDWVRFHFASESELDRSKWMNVLGLAAIGLRSELQKSRIGGFNPGYVTEHSSGSGSNEAGGGGPASLAPKLVLTPSHSRPQSAKGRASIDALEPLESNLTDLQVNTSNEQSVENTHQSRSTSIPFASTSALHFPSTRQLPPTNKQLPPSPHRVRPIAHAGDVSATASTTSSGAVAAICYSESDEETEAEAEELEPSGCTLSTSLCSASSGLPLSPDNSLRLRSSSPDPSHASVLSGDSAHPECAMTRSARSQDHRRPRFPQLLAVTGDSSNSTVARNPPSPLPVRRISGHPRLRAAQLICDHSGTPKRTIRPDSDNNNNDSASLN